MSTSRPFLTFALSSPVRGALWMLVSAVFYTGMAVLVKLLEDRASLGLIFASRAGVGLLAVLPFVILSGPAGLASPRPFRMALRSGYGTIGFFAAFYALAHLPLADAQALSFSRTLFMVILAAFLLREKVGVVRWGAVAVGLVGILIMARPEGHGNWGTLAALVSSLAFAGSIVTVKDLTRDHSSLTLLFYANFYTSLVGLPFLMFETSLPDPYVMGQLVLIGLLGVGAQAAYVRAMALGEASFLGVMDYVRLPLVVLWSVLLFGIWPDAQTLIGAGVVIAATIFLTLHERHTARAAAQIAPPDR